MGLQPAHLRLRPCWALPLIITGVIVVVSLFLDGMHRSAGGD
jgi:hypothetical protein